MASVPLLIAWILLAVAQSVYYIYMFTLLAGMALATSYVVLPVYITEIASDQIRGYLGVLHTVMCKLGLLYAYAVGPFLHVRLMAWLGLVPVVLFLVTFVWLPESPYHLLAVGRRDAADRSVRKLRCTANVQVELAEMQCAVRQLEPTNCSYIELFTTRCHRRGILVAVGMTLLLELCGSQLLLHFAQTIFCWPQC